MIDLKTVNQIKRASVEERLQIIEQILQSLKKDMKQESRIKQSRFQPFKVRKFSLGQEVHMDREELYSERGL